MDMNMKLGNQIPTGTSVAPTKDFQPTQERMDGGAELYNLLYSQ